MENMKDIAVLEAEIAKEEAQINEMYYELGKLYAANYAQNPAEPFAPAMAVIAQAQEKIATYQDQILDLKGVRRCKGCGAEVAKGVAFCSSCGTAMPQEKPENTEGMNQCSNCGAWMRDTMRFCTTCGTAMVKAEEPTPVVEEPAVEAPMVEAPVVEEEPKKKKGLFSKGE